MELIFGDCLEKMKDLSKNSIDIVIADLPYGRFKHLEWDKAIDLGVMWKQLNRICKDRTPIFLFGDMKFGIELINSNPKGFKYEIVWNKEITTTPLLSRIRLGKATEYIFIFYKKQPIYNYAKYHKKIKNKKVVSSLITGSKTKYTHSQSKVYEPTLPTNFIQTSHLNHRGNPVDFSNACSYEPTLPTNVINGRVKRTNKIIKRITEKPQFILEFLLKYFSNPGDICLDICMGSGSCGVACKSLKRKFIGIENNKDHYEKAKKRLV